MMEPAEPIVVQWSPRTQTFIHAVMAAGAWAVIAIFVGAFA